MSTFNITAYLCVVLVIAGSVGSFVISRNRRDLESTIRELYGPPVETRPIRQTPPSTSNYDIIHFRDEGDHPPPRPPPIAPPVKIDPNVLVNLFGYKPGSRPDHESIPQEAPTTEDNKKKVEEDIIKIFGLTTSTKTPELLTATENSTSSGVTVVFDYDHRFLSEDTLRNLFNEQENHDKPTPSGPRRPELDAKTFNLGPGPFRSVSGGFAPVPGLFGHNFGPFQPDAGTARPDLGPFWPGGLLDHTIGSETPESRPSSKDTEVYENNLDHYGSHLGPGDSLTKVEADFLRDSTETTSAVTEVNGSSTNLPISGSSTNLEPETNKESKTSVPDSKTPASTKNSSNSLFVSKYLIIATVSLKVICHQASF